MAADARLGVTLRRDYRAITAARGWVLSAQQTARNAEEPRQAAYAVWSGCAARADYAGHVAGKPLADVAKSVPRVPNLHGRQQQLQAAFSELSAESPDRLVAGDASDCQRLVTFGITGKALSSAMFLQLNSAL